MPLYLAWVERGKSSLSLCLVERYILATQHTLSVATCMSRKLSIQAYYRVLLVISRPLDALKLIQLGPLVCISTDGRASSATDCAHARRKFEPQTVADIIFSIIVLTIPTMAIP